MIRFARQNNAAANITYCMGDAQTFGDYPEWQERFDKAVSFFVLHWCPDHAKALRSILACLKPGGEVLLIVANKATFFTDANQFIRSHVKWGDYVKDVTDFSNVYHFWERSIPDTEMLLKECGWTNIQCEYQEAPSLTEMQQKLFMKTLVAIIQYIPEAEHKAFLQDLWLWALSRFEDKSITSRVLYPGGFTVVHACKGPKDT
ncbi:uncharacterized protein LOC110973133 isoform X1 [Acanthaster planci]|uniref:Uncharacterized protein LOC110973133 isoform X1 n=1 Tax=Acanthaster planci TaxID=133434 RepID=A0A8B7XF45_ACAPL|nr:uncharacterized protein LOC110973133 isoform X1 [Acanthaster planci]